jgi:cytochrome c-type biogenesis protein CcmE
MKTINIGLLVGIAVVAMLGLVFLATSGAIGGASQYMTFAQAKKSPEDVHVVGSWVRREESHYDHEQDVFDFYLQDTTNEVAAVRYHDPMPVNFATAEKVVVQGKYEGETFVADRIFMKCPSKYNDGKLTDVTAEAQR